MRLLIDQNVPDSIGGYFAARGHDVYLGQDVLGRSSPDQLIAITAELQGVVVVTLDKDFKRFKRLLPVGTRNQFAAGAGSIHLAVRESRIVSQLRDEIETIEAYADRAARDGKRVHIRLTETNVTLAMAGGRVRTA